MLNNKEYRIQQGSVFTKISDYEDYLVWVGLIVGAILLLIAPLAKPVWFDEVISIDWGQATLLHILTDDSFNHVPLHPLILHLCRTIFGDNLTVYRIASALPSVVALWLTYKIGSRIRPRVGLLALWLAALSPALILFDRMARYHALLAMLSTMSVYYGLLILDEGRPRDMMVCAVALFLMLLTYPLSLFIIVAQWIYIITRWRFEPLRWRFVGATTIGLMLFMPWALRAVLANIHHPVVANVEDPSLGLGVGGFTRRIGLPIYAFCVGETVYPWNWPVTTVGLGSVLIASLLGFWYLRTKREIVLPIACIAVVVLSALMTSGRLGAEQTVGSQAKRVAFILPLFYPVVSAGILSGRSRAIKVVWTATILLVSLYSIRNYWVGEQFMNPGYTARWDQVISIMQQHSPDNNTAVFSSRESALDFYLDQLPQPVRHESIENPQQFWHSITLKPARFIWLLGRDRGDRVSVDMIDTINKEIGLRYKRVGKYGVMPRSGSELFWMQKMLKRPARPYYIWMELYDTSIPS